MDNDRSWNSSQVVAWTEREGPGLPPSGPRRILSFSLAGSLATVFIGMIASDAVCAEHRAWVEGLAMGALVAAGMSIVGLIRQWAFAPLFTVATAGAGVAIGFIDAVHSPTRGHLIVLGFTVVLVISSWLSARALGSARWKAKDLDELENMEEATDLLAIQTSPTSEVDVASLSEETRLTTRQ